MANENKISQIQVGSVTYDIHDAAARDDISTLSNFFTIRSEQNDNSLNIGASNPVPSGSFANTLRIGTFTDLIKAKETGSDQTFAYISTRKNTETQAYGAFGFERHSDTDNSNIINSVYFRINDDKTCEIQLSDPAAWRDALQLTKHKSAATLSGCTVSGQACWHNNVTCSVTMIDVKLKAILNNGANVNFGTLPSGYRPSEIIYGLANSTNTTFCGKLPVRIDGNGVLTVINRSGTNMPANTAFNVFMTYALG